MNRKRYNPLIKNNLKNVERLEFVIFRFISPISFPTSQCSELNEFNYWKIKEGETAVC
jgi:hypothetical protein